MMNCAQRINAGQPMRDVVIIDSGSPLNCTGDFSLISDDYTEVPPDCYIYGASGTAMRVHGVGSIRNDKFQLQDVYYVPDLNKPNINKTIVSVTKLGVHGYRIILDGGSCSVIDNTKRTWTRQHEIVGKGHIEEGYYVLDYLKVPLGRSPVQTSSEGPELLKSVWNAALSGWNNIAQRLSQRATSAQRPDV